MLLILCGGCAGATGVIDPDQSRKLEMDECELERLQMSTTLAQLVPSADASNCCAEKLSAAEQLLSI
jgi:hypothetical protein